MDKICWLLLENQKGIYTWFSLVGFHTWTDQFWPSWKDICSFVWTMDAVWKTLQDRLTKEIDAKEIQENPSFLHELMIMTIIKCPQKKDVYTIVLKFKKESIVMILKLTTYNFVETSPSSSNAYTKDTLDSLSLSLSLSISISNRSW